MYSEQQLSRYSFFRQAFERDRINYVLDPLTGLVSRQYILSFVRSLIEAGTPFTFGMLDLDNFKFINDTYGHPVGDQALVAAANILSASMTGCKGILVRYGGDEFLIMGCFTDDAAAEAFKQSILQRFEAYRRDHDLPYRFAMSIGYAQYVPGQTLETLVEQADSALYQEKQRTNAGR